MIELKYVVENTALSLSKLWYLYMFLVFLHSKSAMLHGVCLVYEIYLYSSTLYSVVQKLIIIFIWKMINFIVKVVGSINDKNSIA